MQLESQGFFVVSLSVIDFNPTLVQLEFELNFRQSQYLQYFNPTLVQLECMGIPLHFTRIVNFNPTLVQLEWGKGYESYYSLFEFQSHIGAIRIKF